MEAGNWEMEMRDFVDEELELARSLPLTPHYRVEPQCADSILRVLVGAREWLTDPTHWRRGGFFRDHDGDQIEVYDLAEQHSEIGSSCAWGAIRLETNDEGDLDSDAVKYLDTFVPGGCTVVFNDDPSTTHADVLALFDRAIASRTAEVGK